jgi:hypothetical protein
MKMENVVLTYPPEMQEQFARMVEEFAKTNEQPEPKPINEMFLWLDFYRIRIAEEPVTLAALSADKAMIEFRNRYPDA